MPEDLITTTAVIKVDPQSDSSVLSLLCEANKVRDFALARVIVTDADLVPATQDLSLIANLKKSLTEKKAEYYKPIKAHLDAITAAFQTILTPVEDADKITRAKMTAYDLEQKRKAREAEEINRLRMEAARKEMELKGELTESVNLMEAPPPPVKQVTTDAGSASFVKAPSTWELIDINLVPKEYLILDSVKIGKVIRAGGSIPGIKTILNTQLRVTAK